MSATILRYACASLLPKRSTRRRTALPHLTMPPFKRLCLPVAGALAVFACGAAAFAVPVAKFAVYSSSSGGEAAAAAVESVDGQEDLPQALIFDCDGVLADTERDGHRPAFNAAFKIKNLGESVDERCPLKMSLLLKKNGCDTRTTYVCASKRWVFPSLLFALYVYVPCTWYLVHRLLSHCSLLPCPSVRIPNQVANGCGTAELLCATGTCRDDETTTNGGLRLNMRRTISTINNCQ